MWWHLVKLSSIQKTGSILTTNGSTIFKIGVFLVSFGGVTKSLLGIAMTEKCMLHTMKMKLNR